MKRLALYARVSSDKQEREETIDSQLAQLQDLAQKKGLTVVDRNVYLDEGYSGDLMARPGLDRLRDDVRDGLVDTAFFHCPDRLARRYPYQVGVIEELERNGCEIDFVNREIAQTPEDLRRPERGTRGRPRLRSSSRASPRQHSTPTRSQRISKLVM